MNHKKVFRSFIILEWVLLILAVIFGLIGESYLPVELKRYIESSYNIHLTALEYIIIVLSVISLTASIGLFIFWRHARHIYLTVSILGLIFTGFYGPYIMSGWELVFGSASDIVAGVIIGLMYLSSVKKLFKKRSTPINKK